MESLSVYFEVVALLQGSKSISNQNLHCYILFASFCGLAVPIAIVWQNEKEAHRSLV